MNNYNEKEEKKGGIFSGLFGGGSSSGGLGSAAGGGLFASKAGIVGLVLGSATIAAGVGVVYNFIGPSSKPVYSPELFQNSYYEEESSKASQERAMSRSAAPEASTLDMFKEQAKKDGLGLASESGGESGDKSDGAPADGAGANASASADAAAPGGAPGVPGDGAPKLKASSGFGGGTSKMGGGSSGTSIPKMQAGGGLAGGIGAQFAPVYRPPTGKSSAMTASASRLSSSPKYSVPNFNKKGAYGQAKYASKIGAKAAYSADLAGARSSAAEAFTGETSGSGDAGSSGTGAGLGGAGVSNGSKLKANDPSLNKTENSVPEVNEATDEDPWQSTEDKALKFMLVSIGLILVAKMVNNFAKGAPWAKWVVLGLCALAMAAAAVVIAMGIKMMKDYGQTMMGGVYILVGAMLIAMALATIGGAAKADTGGAANSGFWKFMGKFDGLMKGLLSTSGAAASAGSN